MWRPIVLTLLAGFLCRAGVAPADGAQGRRGNGREYADVADWARSREFSITWVRRDEAVRLGNGPVRILLTLDSREARVNGLQVWLLEPVLLRNGSVQVSRLDLETTLKPILAPPRGRPGSRIRTICLDPGHGGKDPGFRVGSSQEKKYTLLLAEEVRSRLMRAGFKVVLTRSTDSFIELSTRPELAKRRNADLFVSLHFNATETGRNVVRGAEVYCLTPAGAPSTNSGGDAGHASRCAGNRFDAENMCLAYQVQKSLAGDPQVQDRGVRRARYAVLRDAVMPAVLIEAGFLSHPVEGRKIAGADYRRRLASAIVEGLMNYKRSVEPRP